MAELKNEYIDMRNVRHKVKHLTAASEDKNSREQMLWQLFHVLTKRNGQTDADSYI